MKIAVALSGGVDSALAALLAKRAGHEVVGVTMKLWHDGRYKGGERDACFGPGEAQDIASAEKLAAMLGIDFKVFDLADEYERIVLDYFRRERSAGRTPNPCVVCNHSLKFALLPQAAARCFGFERFATGHYARIVSSGKRRLAVARAADEHKDQSYFLWNLSQEQLGRIEFPLGELTKTEVRRIAREAGLPMAEKKDSQDFYSGDTCELIGANDREGDIVSTNGKVLGHHKGYWHYTIGQRQGLGIGGGTPYYVIDIRPHENQVVVGRREEAIATAFKIGDINWQNIEPTSSVINAFVKIRSSGNPIGPVEFKDGVVSASCGLFGVAPGQSAVLYSADGAIILGGTIERL